jgi:glycosyltransferase involved in cell wall biosynthesis
MNSWKKIKHKLTISLPLKFKKKILKDIGEGNRRVLIYYKTDPFFSKELRRQYIHTNNEEIVLMVKCFNEAGYSVDLIDREASWEQILKLKNRSYDLYIGNAVGNSAPFHVKIKNEFNIKTKVVYAVGPEPTISNSLVIEQHDFFYRRNGIRPKVRRLVKGGNFADRFTNIDSIISIGEAFSMKSYESLGLPVKSILPTTSPIVQEGDEIWKLKDRKSFLYFGGNGNICKGLDLVIEAFLNCPDAKLDICAPYEEDFFSYYESKMLQVKNITYHGFVEVGADKFNKLTESAAWIIFPACSEACATSVITCMRRGLIPVVTDETAIDIEDFGIEIKNRDPDSLVILINMLMRINTEELQLRSMKTQISSRKYSVNNYIERFREIIASF